MYKDDHAVTQRNLFPITNQFISRDELTPSLDLQLYCLRNIETNKEHKIS